jgi:hypothetical protein
MAPITRGFHGRRPAASGVAALAVLAAVAGAWSGAGEPALATSSCGAQIASAVWHREPQGLRIIITPTRCGRRTAAQTPHAAFDEAIRRGGRGAPDRGSLYWQFVCHANLAQTKATWNLEAWRPDVGLIGTIMAGCNP